MCGERTFGRLAGRESDQAQEGHGERGDPDVPEQAEGPGALHAQEQEAVQAGSDPARHRLHMRPAERARGAPRCGGVRRSLGLGTEEVAGSRQPQAAPGGAGQSEHDTGALRSHGPPTYHGELTCSGFPEED